MSRDRKKSLGAPQKEWFTICSGKGEGAMKEEEALSLVRERENLEDAEAQESTGPNLN